MSYKVFYRKKSLKCNINIYLYRSDPGSLESPDQSGNSRFICHTPLTCYSPRMVLTGEYPNTRSCPTSRDSGCYGSWEQLGLKDASNKIAYNVGLKHPNGVDKDRIFSPLQHTNKENVHPGTPMKYNGEQRLGSRQTNSSGRGSASSGRASVETCQQYCEHRNSDMERSDREFTEEDREVCQITSAVEEDDAYCYNSQSTPKSAGQGMDMSVVSGEPGVIMCSYAGTQTSPNQEYLCDTGKLSYHPKSTYKPQPFPRKYIPKSGPSKDVQVQVMCPLGKSSNSMVDFDAYQIRSHSKDAVHFQRQHSSPAIQLQHNVDIHRKFSDTALCRSDRTQNGGVTPTQVQYDRPPKGRARSIDETGQRPSPSPRDFRSVKKSLVSMVPAKLASERIDLSKEPYSSQVWLMMVI